MSPSQHLQERQGITDMSGLCVTDQSQGDAHVGGMSGIWDFRTNGQLGDWS